MRDRHQGDRGGGRGRGGVSRGRWRRLVLLLIAGAGLRMAAEEPGGALAVPPAAVTADGFAVPQPGRVFEFPRDHGSHPEFRIEWWYVTGHLRDEDGRRFGLQSTFFRTAGPVLRPGERDWEGFGTRQFHLAHAALLDVGGDRFLHQERLHREGWDAAAAVGRLDVRNGNWFLTGDPATTDGLRLGGSVRAEASWDLRLKPIKPLVTFGTNGVSRKGRDPSAASHYLTFPRLQVEGKLNLGGQTRAVRGEAWMDHEFSSSQVGEDQVGWDWAGIQLQDGREIMAYRMRRRDGSADPFSTLAWVDARGVVAQVGAADFDLRPLGTWTSPRTGGRYPLGLELRTRDPATGGRVTYRLEPLRADQEMAGDVGEVPYWEGACRVTDGAGREAGSAYVELTGYAGELARRLR